MTRPAGVDRLGGERDPVRQGRYEARGDERGAGVEEDGVPACAAVTLEDRDGDRSVPVGRAAAQLGGRGGPEPEAPGLHTGWHDPRRRDVEDHPRTVERQLVDAIAVDDEGPLRPEPLGDLAIRGAAAASPTPRSARVAPAGFVSGPRRLKAVRTPISRRVGPA